MAISLIKADGTGDFTTLSAWAASLAADYVDEVAEVEGTIDQSAPLILPSSTDPAGVLTIRAATGQETLYFDGDGRARVDFGPFDFRIQSGSAVTVRVEKIGMRANINGGATMFIDAVPTSADWQFTDCFLKKEGTGGTQLSNNADFPGLKFTNCVLLGLNFSSSWDSVHVDQCSFPGGLATAVALSAPTLGGSHAVNCYVAHNSASFGPIFDLAAGSTGNAIDMSNTRNAGFAIDVINAAFADQYVDPANGDWSLKTGNDLAGAGDGGADIGFILPTGGGGTVISESLTQGMGISPSTSSRAAATAALTQGVGLAGSEQGSAAAIATLAASLGLSASQTAQAFAAQSLVAGIGFGLSMSEALSGVISESLTQGIGLSPSFTGMARAGDALTVGLSLDASLIDRAIIPEAMAGALGLSDSMADHARANVSLTVPAIFGASMQSAASAKDAFSIGFAIGQQLSAFLPDLFTRSAARTFTIPAENRTVTVSVENRTLTVSAENRTIIVEPDG